MTLFILFESQKDETIMTSPKIGSFDSNQDKTP